MAAVTREAHLVNVQADGNHNKFYRLQLHDDGTIVRRWGRVGADGQTKTERGSDYHFQQLLTAKLARGYVEVDVVSNTAPVASQQALARAARSTLVADQSCDTLGQLVDRLVAVNRHRIEVTSGGYISATDNGVTTPLGRVSGHAIAKARAVLNRIAVASGADRTGLVEEYLRLVPQKVGHRAGWAETFINSRNTVEDQSELLDQLESAVTFNGDSSTGEAPAVQFRYKVAELTDQAEFDRLAHLFESTKNSMHSASSLRLNRVFVLTDSTDAEQVFTKRAAQIRNVKELWHGSQAHNILSILKSGLIIPRSKPGFDFHGAMFGDGVYFSEQSSKSLNYSAGFWGGSRDSNCFMFLADVAMGSEYRPTGRYNDHEARHGVNKFGKPWNSINVKAGTAGVRNHEAIVWNLDQIRVKYLLEFDR